ncbi:MAG: alpha/beta hydrolase [Acidimicrobiia bacterium]
MSSEFIDVNGISLHYIDHGGRGPILVMTHGLTANAHSFDGLAKALGDDVRLIAVDLRGRGLSDKPDTGYSMEGHAADVLGLLDHLGLDRAFIGGHSFGGLLTYHIAAHHPERVRRCVVMDAPIDVDEAILEQIKPALDRLGRVLPSWDAYLAAVKEQPYYDGWWDPQIESYYRADIQENKDGTVQSRSNPAHITEAITRAIGIPWSEYLGRIEVPLLLIRATRPYGPPGYPPLLSAHQAQIVLAALPDGRLIEIDGNHMTFLFGEEIRQSAREIVKFLNEAPSLN